MKNITLTMVSAVPFRLYCVIPKAFHSVDYPGLSGRVVPELVEIQVALGDTWEQDFMR